ncbi:MAG: histidine kinase [Clostridia bacterium]
MNDDEKLLSVKDLANRWQKDEGTIRRYVREGILTPCKGVPGMMFTPLYIANLEGVKLERFSPIEKRRLENKVLELEKVIELQSEQLEKIIDLGIESMKIMNKQW